MNTELLLQYSTGLSFFSHIFQASPSQDMLQALCADNLFSLWENWEVFQGEEACPQAEVDKAIQALSAAYGPQAVTSPEATKELALALHQDHLALFSGPTPSAAPWESVWREKDRLLFGEQTEKVRHCYLAWGLSTDRAGHEPEDHLGLELAFMVYLLETLLEGPMEGANDLPADPRQTLVTFLDDHILAWADDCLHQASENATTVLYQQSPTLCLALLHGLRRDVPSL